MQVGKCTYGYCDHTGPPFYHVGEGRSAFRTKSVCRPMTAVCNSFPHSGFSRNRDLVFWPPCLRCKCAPRSFLALEAMAYRNAHRLALTGRGKLPASARRCSFHHVRHVQIVSAVAYSRTKQNSRSSTLQPNGSCAPPCGRRASTLSSQPTKRTKREQTLPHP
jgi:hypothetical protein